MIANSQCKQNQGVSSSVLNANDEGTIKIVGEPPHGTVQKMELN